MPTVEIPYYPRKHQQEIHKRLKRFNVLVCHRRFGKTVLCINQLISDALKNERGLKGKPGGRYMYIAPLYRQAKSVAWDYLQMYTDGIPGRRVYQNELRVDLPNGSRIQLFGAENYDALRGQYADGVVADEPAQMSPKLWTEVVRPMLADYLGYAIFIGTPKGRNAFYDRWVHAQKDPDWAAMMYKASETKILPQEELWAARRDMSPPEYEQEFECSFEAAIVGSYWGELMTQAEEKGRITEVPHDPALGVVTAWDLGISDACSIWFIQRGPGGTHRFIDHYEMSGEGLAHYARVLQEKAREHGYVYEEHIAPHDIEVRDIGSGTSRKQTARELGINFRVAPKTRVEEGIDAVRRILPMSYFDRSRCERGIEALKQYRKEWDEKGQLFRSHPLHDWTSHAADAARYYAIMKPAGRHQQGPINYPNYAIA